MAGNIYFIVKREREGKRDERTRMEIGIIACSPRGAGIVQFQVK